MPASFSVSAIAKAPKDAVWQVLADFPNIADYTDSVKASHATNEHALGVGATRRCDFSRGGSAEEEIIGFSSGEKLVISLAETKGLPLKSSETTFSVTEINADTTKLTMSVKFEAKGGPFSGIVGKLLQRRLPKPASRTVQDLAASSERISAAK